MQAVVNYFWTRYERMIYKSCRNFAYHYRADFHEVLSDAYLGFAKCLDCWDSNRGCFSTLLVRCLKQAILTGQRKRTAKPMRELLDDVASKKATSPIWEQLSQDAALVAHSLLSKPPQSIIKKPQNLEMSGEQFQAALSEIKQVLQKDQA